MVKKQQKSWVYSPGKPQPATVPATLKAEVERRAQELLETVLKPKYIQPPPENPQFNYVMDIYTKWYRSYFYFIAKYRVVGPYAIAPSFESKFARLAYAGNNKFNLAYMRHTEQWADIFYDLSLDECLKSVAEDPTFSL